MVECYGIPGLAGGRSLKLWAVRVDRQIAPVWSPRYQKLAGEGVGRVPLSHKGFEGRGVGAYSTCPGTRAILEGGGGVFPDGMRADP